MGDLVNPVLAFSTPDKIQPNGESFAGGSTVINGRRFQKVRISAPNDPPTDRVLFFGPTGLLEGMHMSQAEGGGAGPGLPPGARH